MTELETMQRAKTYLDKLAQGIDPITDQPVPTGDCLQNPRLSRCFRYISGILEKVIENDGQIGTVETPAFTITQEHLAKVQLTGEPLRIADFVDRILRATNYEGMQKLSPIKLTNWLLQNGYLTQENVPDGSRRRIPTQAGLDLGIRAQMCKSDSGEYLGIFYDDKAQKFLLKNLSSIIGE